MLNETYSVREITLTREETEIAIQEYIGKHNIPPTVFPTDEDCVSFVFNYHKAINGPSELSYIKVKLRFGGKIA